MGPDHAYAAMITNCFEQQNTGPSSWLSRRPRFEAGRI